MSYNDLKELGDEEAVKKSGKLRQQVRCDDLGAGVTMHIYQVLRKEPTNFPPNVFQGKKYQVLDGVSKLTCWTWMVIPSVWKMEW